MGLNDMAIRNLKPPQTPYKKGGGEGLYLLVTPGGCKLWQLAYPVRRKEKTIALDQHPAVAPARGGSVVGRLGHTQRIFL